MRGKITAVVLIVGLLGVAPVDSAGASSYPAQLSAQSQTLKSGCSSYRYGYRIAPTDADWMLEVTIRDAAGVGQSFQYFNSGEPGDATAASPRFTLCAPSVTKRGRFTLTGRYTRIVGPKQTVTELPVVGFMVRAKPKQTANPAAKRR